MIVYKLTSLDSGKAYIGITKRPLRTRLRAHVRDAKKVIPGKRMRQICMAIAKYGIDRFTVETLYECSSEPEMIVCERGLISSHGTLFPNGYNLNTGFGGSSVREVAEKISIGNRGKVRSDKARKNYSAAAFLRRHTDETKKKISVISSLRRYGEPTKAKLRQEMQRRESDKHKSQTPVPYSKIDPEVVAQIKVLSADGNFPISKMAIICGVKFSTVNAIRTGKIWKWLDASRFYQFPYPPLTVPTSAAAA